ALPGTATALGGWRSKPASYSQTRRSSARQKTLSSPQISWSRRTSADGEVAVTVGVTRGGTASPGGAGERVAREPRALGPASPGEVTTREWSGRVRRARDLRGRGPWGRSQPATGPGVVATRSASSL